MLIEPEEVIEEENKNLKSFSNSEVPL